MWLWGQLFTPRGKRCHSEMYPHVSKPEGQPRSLCFFSSLKQLELERDRGLRAQWWPGWGPEGRWGGGDPWGAPGSLVAPPQVSGGACHALEAEGCGPQRLSSVASERHGAMCQPPSLPCSPIRQHIVYKRLDLELLAFRFHSLPPLTCHT